MGLFNIQKLSLKENELTAKRINESTQPEAPILQWVPSEEKIPVSVVLPDAGRADGYAEVGLTNESVNSVVQLIRFGFCRVDQADSNKVTLYFAHN